METAIRQSRNIIKISIIGPESTGKSTLATQLASHFKTVWVREFAREYLEERNGGYTETDLLAIAKGQITAENSLEADGIVICDTDLITIKIWSDYKYGRCDPWITEQIQNRKYHLHLLCFPDIPWEADPLRENSHDRKHLYNLYKNELVENNFPFAEIKGGKAERLKTAIDVIGKMVLPRV